VETILFASLQAPDRLPQGITFPPEGAIRIFTDHDVVGEYVGGLPSDHDAVAYLAHRLLGRDALDREGFYEIGKFWTRQFGRVGHSVIDIALWDLAGKWYRAPVYELLGARKRRLPAYASTTIGDDPSGGGDRDHRGLSAPDAYADFAERCHEVGYPAFKIHGWLDGDVEREIALARAVGDRVGDRMVLMDDVSSRLPTFGAAVRLGLVLDDYRYFWYEDPFADTGISSTAHRRLRERVRTPLLITEHLRTLEPKIDFLVNGGTDFVRADPDHDGGITGAMKIAHAAEGLGTDVELHFCGPAHRQVMTAIRNTNYYEMGLLHPDYEYVSPASTVAHDYRDGLEAIGADGCVEASDRPGLGVEYHWELIESRRVGGGIWES
jgi:L-alanine-DL-glutamate epimerase-like enolase superfamily enzyme